MHDGFDAIRGMAYTSGHAEELRSSFRDMITAFSEMTEEDQKVSKSIVKKCFKTMEVHSHAAQKDIWPSILESLELLTDSFGSGEKDAMSTVKELKIR